LLKLSSNVNECKPLGVGAGTSAQDGGDQEAAGGSAQEDKHK